MNEKCVSTIMCPFPDLSSYLKADMDLSHDFTFLRSTIFLEIVRRAFRYQYIVMNLHRFLFVVWG